MVRGTLYGIKLPSPLPAFKLSLTPFSALFGARAYGSGVAAAKIIGQAEHFKLGGFGSPKRRQGQFERFTSS
jgi:hypothetical protein